MFMFLQDMDITSKKFRSKGDTTKQWSLSTFQNLIRFLKILCLFDSETWDSCQERVKFTRFILRWDYMSDVRVGVDLLSWGSHGWIGCCNFMAAQSVLNQQFSKILSYHRICVCLWVELLQPFKTMIYQKWSMVLAVLAGTCSNVWT